MSTLKIGDPVWIYDANHRVYAPTKTRESYSSGGPIYRESWRQWFIVGENRVSWIVARSPEMAADHRANKKIPKNPENRPITARGIAYSADEVDLAVWDSDHRHRVARMLDRCDTDTLRKIADLLGYTA